MGSSSRATTYALGNTQIQLINAETGSIKLFYDAYDWDYHNYSISEPQVLHRGQVPRLPNSTRDKLIYLERARTGINDSHGFPVFIYGIGKIKTQ